MRAVDDEFGRSASIDIVCECGDEKCFDRVRIDRYERLRRDATTFAVVPGHELEDVERVVEKSEAYNVVRKLDGEPARVAVETDPR